MRKRERGTQVVHKLKTNPNDRRIIMSAWNPADLNEMALPPCHMFCQSALRLGISGKAEDKFCNYAVTHFTDPRTRSLRRTE